MAFYDKLPKVRRTESRFRKDKEVLVTGASSGIGRAVVLLFAANGAKVVAAGINGREL